MLSSRKWDVVQEVPALPRRCEIPAWAASSRNPKWAGTVSLAMGVWGCGTGAACCGWNLALHNPASQRFLSQNTETPELSGLERSLKYTWGLCFFTHYFLFHLSLTCPEEDVPAVVLLAVPAGAPSCAELLLSTSHMCSHSAGEHSSFKVLCVGNSLP